MENGRQFSFSFFVHFCKYNGDEQEEELIIKKVGGGSEGIGTDQYTKEEKCEGGKIKGKHTHFKVRISS